MLFDVSELTNKDDLARMASQMTAYARLLNVSSRETNPDSDPPKFHHSDPKRLLWEAFEEKWNEISGPSFRLFAPIQRLPDAASTLLTIVQPAPIVVQPKPLIRFDEKLIFLTYLKT